MQGQEQETEREQSRHPPTMRSTPAAAGCAASSVSWSNPMCVRAASGQGRGASSSASRAGVERCRACWPVHIMKTIHCLRRWQCTPAIAAAACPSACRLSAAACCYRAGSQLTDDKVCALCLGICHTGAQSLIVGQEADGGTCRGRRQARACGQGTGGGARRGGQASI